VSAIRWVSANRDQLGGGQKIILLGDSAGANLAAASALVLRDDPNTHVDAQVLLYPCLAPAELTNFPSYEDFADGPLMTRREMNWFWNHYLASPADGKNPLASPLFAQDLRDLPATTIVVAEMDPLRDEGVAYAAALRDAGVEVEVVTFAGAAHGFWWMDAVMCQALELNDLLANTINGT
jgi:acetyl esterase